MVAVYSDQITNYNAVPQVMNKAYDENKVRAIYFHYKNTSGSTLATSSTIDLAKIPANSRVLPNSAMFNSAMTGVTLDLGYPAHKTTANVDVAADADAYMAAKSVATAGMSNFDANNENGYVVTGEQTLQATVGGAAFPTNGWISGVVFIIVP